MKFRATLLLVTASLLCIIQTGCRRSASDVWEDAKTCGRQVGRGVGALTGQRGISRQVRSANDFRGPCDNDFIPLNDEDLANRLTASGAFDQPRNTPGEEGSGLPGIDSFSEPATAAQMRLFQPLHFDTNEYAIRGSENRQILSNITNYMQQNPNLYLFCEGHCDQRGPAAYNLALGAKRSNAVRNELVQNGVDPERVHTISYGKERLLDEGTTPEAMQRNRRAQFKLFFKGQNRGN